MAQTNRWDNVDAPTSSASGDYVSSFNNDDKFRIMTAPVTYREFFEEIDGKAKPVRSKERFTENDIEKRCKIDKFGGKKQSNVFAFFAWDYQQKKIIILQFKKNALINGLIMLAKDEDWGNPTGYDVKVKKEGQGKETTYNLVAVNKKDIDFGDEFGFYENNYNLEALITNGNPFEPKQETVDDLPFN